MTTEELLKPRYKVIADYPKSLYNVGDIINAGTTSQDCIYCDHEGPRMRHYPHLFQPLQWWEERKPEDLPEYVKIKRFYEGKPCAVYKIGEEVEWNFSELELIGIRFIDGGGLLPEYVLPAIREECENYLQTTNQLKDGQ